MVTIPGDYPQPYRFALDRRLVTIGRASDNDVPIASASVSHLHSQIHRVLGGFELRDCGSMNGVRAAGERVERLTLSSSQSFLVGEATLDFTLNPEEVEALAAELSAGPAQVATQDQEFRVEDPEELPAAAIGAGQTIMILLVLVLLAGLAVYAALALR